MNNNWINHRRKTSLLLIGIIFLLIFYSVFSKSNSVKEIRKLTIKIEAEIDLIRNIQFRYDSLEKAFGEIHQQLHLTKENLNYLHGSIDSIMNSNITSASRINNSLKKLIEDQQKLEILNSDSSSFRFK